LGKKKELIKLNLVLTMGGARGRGEELGDRRMEREVATAGKGWDSRGVVKGGAREPGRSAGGCPGAGQARRRVDGEWMEAGGWGQPRGTGWQQPAWAAQVACV